MRRPFASFDLAPRHPNHRPATPRPQRPGASVARIATLAGASLATCLAATTSGHALTSETHLRGPSVVAAPTPAAFDPFVGRGLALPAAGIPDLIRLNEWRVEAGPFPAAREYVELIGPANGSLADHHIVAVGTDGRVASRITFTSDSTLPADGIGLLAAEAVSGVDPDWVIPEGFYPDDTGLTLLLLQDDDPPNPGDDLDTDDDGRLDALLFDQLNDAVSIAADADAPRYALRSRGPDRAGGAPVGVRRCGPSGVWTTIPSGVDSADTPGTDNLPCPDTSSAQESFGVTFDPSGPASITVIEDDAVIARTGAGNALVTVTEPMADGVGCTIDLGPLRGADPGDRITVAFGATGDVVCPAVDLQQVELGSFAIELSPGVIGFQGSILAQEGELLVGTIDWPNAIIVQRDLSLPPIFASIEAIDRLADDPVLGGGGLAIEFSQPVIVTSPGASGALTVDRLVWLPISPVPPVPFDHLTIETDGLDSVSVESASIVRNGRVYTAGRGSSLAIAAPGVRLQSIPGALAPTVDIATPNAVAATVTIEEPGPPQQFAIATGFEIDFEPATPREPIEGTPSLNLDIQRADEVLGPVETRLEYEEQPDGTIIVRVFIGFVLVDQYVIDVEQFDGVALGSESWPIAAGVDVPTSGVRRVTARWAAPNPLVFDGLGAAFGDRVEFIVPWSEDDTRLAAARVRSHLLGDLGLDVTVTPAPSCPADLDGNGSVGISDLLTVLASWGTCVGCPADFDADGVIGFDDLLVILQAWGPCS